MSDHRFDDYLVENTDQQNHQGQYQSRQPHADGGIVSRRINGRYSGIQVLPVGMQVYAFIENSKKQGHIDQGAYQ